MIQYPRVTKTGPLAKGPYQFLRYLNKDKLAAELLDPTKAEKKVIEGKTYYTAKIIRESTPNLSLAKVNREQYDIPEEVNQINSLV